MTNGEKFKDEIWRIACTGSMIALKDGEICRCDDISCSECSFLHGSDDCEEHIKEWCKSEYVEYEIDWDKVPVDTKVMVKENECDNWLKRHFAGCQNGLFKCFDNGLSSYTAEGIFTVTPWKIIMFADKEDEIKYRKRVE